MAYKLLGFHAYYCDDSTYENLQYCGDYNIVVAGSTNPLTSNLSGNADTVYNGSIALLDNDAIPALTGVGMVSDTLERRFGLDYLTRFVPNLRLNVANNTGVAARLKLVTNNGDYAISTTSIANGDKAFGASLQPKSYRLFWEDGTALNFTLDLTATGPIGCCFFVCKGYSGGDLPLLTYSNFIVHCVEAPYNYNRTLAYVHAEQINTSGHEQDVTNWLNAATPIVFGYNVTYDLTDCTGDSENPAVIPPNATITPANFTPDPGYSFVFNSVYIDGDGFPEGTPIIYDWDPDTGRLKIGPITSNIVIHVHAYTDPYSDLPIDGETDIPGGEVIPVPSLPGLGAVSAGVIGLFAPSPSQMQALANYMWTDFGGTGTTVEDILSEIVEALKRAISNPLDYVVGLNIIPSQGLSIGSDRAIRFGFTNSGVSMPQLTSQYFVVDCGTLRFDTLCGDTFLDYAPYSKFSIYLPYVGIKEVDANDFVGHTIGVIYHGDVVTGGVTAYITKDGSVMYQYSGCCALNVPLSSDGWGSTIAGAVQIATSMVAGGFAGGAAGVAESAVKGAAAAAANPSLLSPKVQHSGAVSGGAGCMGIQTPFVIREAVRFHSTAGMNSVSGYPSFYYKSLGSVSGYTVVLDVHLRGIPATSEEIAEIESLLKSGVVL